MVKNLDGELEKQAFNLGAVSMKPENWKLFKEHLEELLMQNFDLGKSDLYKDYIKERSGYDFPYWLEWKKKHITNAKTP